MAVAVLFARSDSVYKGIPGTDVFDLARDARTYSGCAPVVAHPPCRGWGRLRHLAKVRPGELECGLFAVEQVRRCGGVLEHPHASTLWEAAGLPVPGKRDAHGGWTLPVLQGDFGHRAPKATWLYVCGVEPGRIPDLPFRLEQASGRVELMGRREREATPLPFALYLVELASRANGGRV